MKDATQCYIEMCYNGSVKESGENPGFTFFKEGEFVGRPRKFKTAKAMEEAWEDFKVWCNNQSVLTHEFSAKNSEFVSKALKRSITYTIEGFCVHVGLARQAFYDTYVADPRYSDIVTRMKEECEIDARMKFELGMIEPRLAPLWMSKHGYSTKAEAQGAQGQEDDPITKSLKETFMKE